MQPVAPPVDQGATRLRYVCMPGSPYTGSTLLGFLLNTHPECASIGAAVGLTARVDLDSYLCSCGTPFRGCGFWNRVAARTVELGTPVPVFRGGDWPTHVRVSRRRWLNGLLIRSLGNTTLNAARDAVVWRAGPVRRTLSEARATTWGLARAVLETTGKRVFVDTARDHQRPKYLRQHPMLDVRVIHLVRDPRGTTASIMKHTGVDLARAARQWRHYNAEADRVKRLMPRGSWMLLRYEELCADPQGTLDRIARFVDVQPAPAPPDLGTTEHHIIGNSMRLRAIEGIREDRTWEDRLDERDLRVIARIVGRTSHRLGYDWP